MTRKTIKTVFLVLLAVLTLSSISEAAPRKTVRHRVRHSQRVTPAKKPAIRKSQTTRAAPATTTKRIVKHKTTTKPR
jgi:hypothetical protein